MFDLKTLQEECNTIEGINGMMREQLYYAYKYVEQGKIKISDECFSVLTSLMCYYF